jgi:hypothetical protein
VLTSWLITTVIFLTAIAGAGHVAAVGSRATSSIPAVSASTVGAGRL